MRRGPGAPQKRHPRLSTPRRAPPLARLARRSIRIRQRPVRYDWACCALRGYDLVVAPRIWCARLSDRRRMRAPSPSEPPCRIGLDQTDRFHGEAQPGAGDADRTNPPGLGVDLARRSRVNAGVRLTCDFWSDLGGPACDTSRREGIACLDTRISPLRLSCTRWSDGRLTISRGFYAKTAVRSSRRVVMQRDLFAQAGGDVAVSGSSPVPGVRGIWPIAARRAKRLVALRRRVTQGICAAKNARR